jgi:hypothetical integral membrane protein (TIGR02206 family)
VAADRFQAFTGQHYAVLVLLVVGAVALVRLGRARRGTPGGRRTGRVLAVLLTCVTVPSQVYQLTPGDYELGTSLPLQLCDVAWVAAVWGLWTHRPLAVALTYYWGLTLTVQGVVTPSLAEAFPHPRFWAFWGMHLLVVWSAFYLTLGLGLGPRWRDYRRAAAVTAGWAVAVYVVDVALGVNYGYLVHKPASASLLDPLGPWPVYLVVAAAVLLGVWALMTWPWAALAGGSRPGRAEPRPGGPRIPG